MTIMCRLFYCSGGGVAHQQEQEAPAQVRGLPEVMLGQMRTRYQLSVKM